MTAPESTSKTVYLHGWCGHADELEGIRPAIPGRILAPVWMPAPGTVDLEPWPLEDRSPGEAEAAMRVVADDLVESVRRMIVDAGFVGATLIGHSMGGALACVLAADPLLAVRRVVLIDSSTPMLPERRSGLIDRMTGWLDRAASSGRLATQAGWIADCSSWVPDFFHLDDQGAQRLRIERRFMFAPVVEAAAAIGGAVQWPIDESLETLSCPIHAIAGDPGRMPVDAMRAARPDAEIVTLEGVGHYPHVFAADRVRDLLARWLGE
jgi:esterase